MEQCDDPNCPQCGVLAAETRLKQDRNSFEQRVKSAMYTPQKSTKPIHSSNRAARRIADKRAGKFRK